MLAIFPLTTVWNECHDRAELSARAAAGSWRAAYYSVDEVGYSRYLREDETAATALTETLAAYRDDPISIEIRRTFEPIG
jgi:hypothetical protein